MEPSTSLPGAHIGKYRILALIAVGGMGRVYKAKDEQLGRIVALKILAPELSRNPILVERFRREARHAACLSHKNIVTLYESDEADGFLYLAMEYVEGVDLAEYIRRKGKLEPEEARRLLIQACKALEHAFTVGITHRDIKPSNFLLANEEGRCRVKLTDLGLSRMQSDEDFRVTQAGSTVGTVDYMAPEQARDSALSDVRSDIYSLGCTLYHMLAGVPPFADGGLGERVYKHMSVDPVDVRTFNPNVPAGLWAVLRRMMSKQPDDRFQNPTDLIEALRSIPADRDLEGADVLLDDGPGDDPETPRPGSSADLSDSSAPGTQVSEAARPPSGDGAEPSPGDAAPKARQVRRKPLTSSPELKTTPPVDPLSVTPEQRNNANAQFTRAAEVISAGGDPTYAVQLLLASCKLDPGNLTYRKTLRQVIRDSETGKRGGWLGSLVRLPGRNRLKTSLRAGAYRKVLEDGEEFLTRYPGDVATHLDMAAAAEALSLGELATWLLEQARADEPDNVEVLRALANDYAEHQRFAQAIAVWERLKKLEPDSFEARDKIRELAVAETLARSQFRR